MFLNSVVVHNSILLAQGCTLSLKSVAARALFSNSPVRGVIFRVQYVHVRMKEKVGGIYPGKESSILRYGFFETSGAPGSLALSRKIAFSE